MRILGISAHYHDSAAALLVDGVPVAAAQEERFSRRKGDPAFPLGAIDWCLRQGGGIAPGDLDAVVFYEKPMLKFERMLTSLLRTFPRSRRSFVQALRNSLGGKLWVKGIIAAELNVPPRRILFTEHHQAHAAAAFFPAPTDEAALLIADGVGEWATLSVGRARRRRDGASDVELVREIRYPHSLGLLYSTFTAYLGYAVNDGEYKLMGLAAFGQPRFADEVRRVVRRTNDGGFALALEYFSFPSRPDRMYSPRFIDLFGPARRVEEPLDPTTTDGIRFADIAASVQVVLEEILVDIARRLQRETGLTDLCFGGGVALNGRANARLLAHSGFSRVLVPSAPGDAGSALGAALFADRIHFARPDVAIPDHPFWGPRPDTAELERLGREGGHAVSTPPDDASLLCHVADALAAGQVVAWMEGAAEFGPRALGHRSLLAAPHDRAMRERLNNHVKYREGFRPFAPVVPAAVAGRYFDLPPGGARLARFMSGVFPVRPEWRARLAAVTHVDGTARVQVLEAEMAPRLHRLLLAYGDRIGIPILLNTSLNLAGEPIVGSAAEGYSTFRRGDIDLLVVEGLVLTKERRRARTAADETRLPETSEAAS